MKYSVKFTTRAKKDIVSIIDYISQTSVVSSAKVHKMLLTKANSLADFPFRGVRREDIVKDGYMILEGSYYIYYQVIDTSVNILRILHQSRNVHNMIE